MSNSGDLSPGSERLSGADIDLRWYRDLVESAPDGMVLIDAEGRIVLVNAQAEQLFGYGRHELLGQPVEMLVPEQQRRSHMLRREGYFGEPRTRGMGLGVELTGRRKDGAEFPVEISLSPQHTERGLFVMAAVRNAADRKRANDKFKALLEAAPDAMVIIDQGGIIRLANAQTERVFGYHRDALIGKLVEVLIPERLRARHVAHRADYFKAPSVRLMGTGNELLGRRKDGSEFPIEISLSPLQAEEGVWATAAVRDISDRKTERDAAARLAAIVESSNDAILGKDLEGRITSWNNAAEKLYGYRAEQIIGQPIEVLIPDDREKEEADILARVRSGERITHYETDRVRRDGRLIRMSLTISPILDSSGRIVGASTIGRDITEQKKAERMFRDLLETAPDAMVIIDQRGKIVLLNAQAERMFGYRREELIGQAVETLIPQQLRQRHEQHRQAFVRDPGQRPMGSGLDLRARRKDGSEFEVEISLGPLESESGTLITAAVRDITERRAFERQLEDYAENLKRSNRELEQFAYIASHDLRAPLRSLSGFSQLLQSRYGDKLDESAREFLSYIARSAKQMQDLIDDLLGYSRLSKVERKLETVELEEVFADVERQLKAVLSTRKVELTHEPLPAVLGVRHELLQLLQNLISNAIKFQPSERPRVHVGAQRDGAHWRISVRDEGIGIGAEYRDKIFQIFQRLHTNDEYEGTGVGLAICQKIAEHHGGRIWVESAPGEGSTFYFTLQPAAAASV
ncbi:MAG: PAS domain S-box protein [Nevskiales bacterium]|nr:PAS domain S-box protein [Nevskiales bacterium]